MLPLLPNKNIAARDLWPLKEGRLLLKNIENQGQLLSSKNDLYDNYNIARQKLSNAVQIQQNLKIHLSKQRCNDPAIKNVLISYYLTVYAHKNPTSEILVKLFKQ